MTAHRLFLIGVVLAVFVAVPNAVAVPPAIVTGQDAGWPEVRAWDAHGAAASGDAPWGGYNIQFAAYPTYREGVRVAVGDVNGDGRNEIVTAPGKDSWSEIRVFDGKTYKQLAEYPPYPGAGWWGGTYVATGDTNGDGRAEIVTGLDQGCCTQIHVLDGPSGGDLGGFNPFGNQAQTGVRVAAADLNGDGKAELLAVAKGNGSVQAFATNGGAAFRTLDTFASGSIVSIAAGDVLGTSRPELVAAAGSQVKVIDVQSGATLLSLFPFGSGSSAAEVAVADVDGDGHNDIVASAQSSAGTQVKAFDARTGKELASFFVLEPGVVPGASLAAGDLNGDGKAEIVLGGGPAQTPWPPTVNGPDQRVAVYEADGTLAGSFSAYPGVFQGGVRVAFGDVDGDGKRDIVTAPGPGMEPELDVYSQDWFNTRDRGTRFSHFLAYEATFRGGVSVAVGAVLAGTTSTQIVTGPGPGRPADVRVFDSAGNRLLSFRAFEDSYAGGVSVAAGDLNGDGRAEIVVGTLTGPPRVRAFNADGTPFGPVVVPWPESIGAEVAVADVSGNGRGVVLAGQATGSNPELVEIIPADGTVLQSVQPAPELTGGIRLGSGDLDGDGRDEILVGSGYSGDGFVRVLDPSLRRRPALGLYQNGIGLNVAGPARIGLPIRADRRTAKAVVGKRLTVVLARFVDAAPTRVGPLHATVDGRVAVIRRRSSNVFDVTAVLRYKRTGTYGVTVTFGDAAGRMSTAYSAVIVRKR